MTVSRRTALASALGVLLAPRAASAFGDGGAFHTRLLVAGGKRVGAQRESAASRWAWELAHRTSAPARLVASEVLPASRALLGEPFVIWAGASDPGRLGASELRGLERYLRLGGMIVADDSEPASGAFGRGVRRELARVLPSAAPVTLDPSHVLYKTFYLVERPVGRVLGAPDVQAIVRGGTAQVLLLSHDLLGALARSRSGQWSFEVEPGGPRQREQALRFAVNIAMYLLCSDYKDDQVHAPWLLQRKARMRR